MITRYSLILPALFGTTIALAQVPNGGFENWTGQVPDGWSNNNIAPLNLLPVTQSTMAYSGSFAVRGEVLPPPPGSKDPYPPVLQNLATAVSSAPAALTGHYRFDPAQPGDQLTVSITVLDAGSGFVGIGYAVFSDEQGSYAAFEVPIDYSFGNGNPPAVASIAAAIGNDAGTPAIASWFLLDDLDWQSGTGTPELASPTIHVGALYPQPVANTARLPLHLDSPQRLTVELVDLVGRRADSVVKDVLFAAGDHQVLWTPSTSLANGHYVLRVTTANSAFTVPVQVQR